MIVRRRFRVRGIVQGVGFRPFVYRLALRCGLGGWVRNDSHGVVVEVEGDEGSVEAFAEALPTEVPPLAMVTSLEWEPVEPSGETAFAIVRSSKNAATATLISPDIAVCGNCLTEMNHPGDRRHRYPFINCTNCGPRYTIIEDIPYDRPKTSMRHFRMCPACQAEYDDPGSRRFHAQPNACAACGPRLLLLDRDGRALPEDPLTETVTLLKTGGVAAIKGVGGFHLACDATSPEAVRGLRRRKLREEKPLAVMVPDMDAAARLARLTPEEAAELQSARRPIVLLPKRAGSPAALEVAPGNDRIGVMLPYAPLHHLLLGDGGFTALVMTSANLSEEPICIDNDEAVRRLSGIADLFLAHDRVIHLRTDDSVVRIDGGRRHPLRRSRGFAPAPVVLGRHLRPVLAVGAELKNVICLTRGNLAFLSQHVGDLANEEALDFFRMTVEHLERILECRGEVVGHDLHPDYLATRWALEQKDRPAVGVQHHHAHAVACMAEHRLEGEVLAVTFDGTGYGDDGHAWGGEVLVADRASFRRAGHLLEVPLPGGDAAAREPWRMAASYLHRLRGEGYGEALPPLAGRVPEEAWRVIGRMLQGGINLHPTTSAGRLFDAVASLLGFRDRVSFEGQAAMELEAAATASGVEEPGAWEGTLDTGDGPMVLNTLPLVEGLLADLAGGGERGVLAARFHESLALLTARALRVLRDREGLERVVLSGGVFQNANLLRRTIRLLERDGFSVFRHEQVPSNDGGIALGQAVVAHERFFGDR